MPILLFLGGLAIYGTLIIAVVIAVQAIVRSSHAFVSISESLREIAAAMRRRAE
jgi:hypothetical protein